MLSPPRCLQKAVQAAAGLQIRTLLRAYFIMSVFRNLELSKYKKHHSEGLVFVCIEADFCEMDRLVLFFPKILLPGSLRCLFVRECVRVCPGENVCRQWR